MALQDTIGEDLAVEENGVMMITMAVTEVETELPLTASRVEAGVAINLRMLY